jgi:hypothetical protein
MCLIRASPSRPASATAKTRALVDIETHETYIRLHVLVFVVGGIG